jgi:uncharacterized protein (TIGR02145 family)
MGYIMKTGILFVIALTLSCSGDKNSSKAPLSAKGADKGSDIRNYRTVKIGNQTWMAENLNYDIEGSACYANDPANCEKYGRYYNWATAMSLPPNCNSSLCASSVLAKHRGICPSGWHLPTNEEWDELIDYTGGYMQTGKYLKTSNGWNSGGNGTDKYGFAAVPGGGGGGRFLNAGYTAYWWTATEGSNAYTYIRGAYYGFDIFIRRYNSKQSVFPVRCVQD